MRVLDKIIGAHFYHKIFEGFLMIDPAPGPLCIYNYTSAIGIAYIYNYARGVWWLYLELHLPSQNPLGKAGKEKRKSSPSSDHLICLKQNCILQTYSLT